MSHAEWHRWLLYRRKHGVMTDARRYDRPAALLAHIYAQVHTKPGSAPPDLVDFMPWSDREPATIDDIARELGAL